MTFKWNPLWSLYGVIAFVVFSVTFVPLVLDHRASFSSRVLAESDYRRKACKLVDKGLCQNSDEKVETGMVDRCDGARRDCQMTSTQLYFRALHVELRDVALENRAVFAMVTSIALSGAIYIISRFGKSNFIEQRAFRDDGYKIIFIPDTSTQKHPGLSPKLMLGPPADKFD